MSKNRVFVIGVGMTKFEKPGSREGWDYPAMAKESGTKALEDAGITFERDRAGPRRLRLRRVDVRAARRLRARHDRDPDHQRQQQLLHRVDRAVPGRAVGTRRAGRLRTGAGLREDAARLAVGQLSGPRTAAGSPHPGRGGAASSSRSRRRRGCSARPVSNTCSATAPPPSTSPRSARRTIGIR